MVRIKIEEKHIYTSREFDVSGNPSTTGMPQIGQVINFVPILYPEAGTDEFNRVGRKISSKSLVFEGFVRLRNGNVANSVGDLYDGFITDIIAQSGWGTNYEFNTDDQPLDISLRHMLVEFDHNFVENPSAGDLVANMWLWYNTLHIYTGDQAVTSNRSMVLRESTAYTGQFNILYDKIHHLDLRHPIVHFKDTVSYKRELNFGSSTTNLPSNKIVMDVWIGPTNVYVDYGSNAFGSFINQTFLQDPTFDPLIARIDSTLKLSYVDV